MATIEMYRKKIKTLLQEYAALFSDSEVETQILFDETHDHYQLMDVGWQGDFNRVYGILIHVDIRDGKIWVQRDRTEGGIAIKLAELGVPKTDIVLGFQSPFKRPFTEFAVA